jgi:pimeloyl-[acyl-carrier protein] methyl ester esterase
MSSKFKFFDRGFKDTLVLVPGWATDYRIFSSLELGYNYLIQADFDTGNFNARLSEELRVRAITHVSLCGWSLGGFLAAEFASDNARSIDELILISIRERFDPPVLKDTEAKLRENKKAYLYKFYLEWFSNNDTKKLAWFKKNLLRDYAAGMELKELVAGLEYLADAGIDAQRLTALRKITIVHGSQDKIMPVNEARALASSLPNAKFVCIEGAGHIPFLTRGFIREFKNNG